MIGYEAADVFATLDDVDPRAYIGLGIASLGYYIQYVSNVRTGFRERKHATPVGCNMWNFADDFLYVLMFDRWFGGGEYSHWFTQALWFGMCAWVTLELITHYQTIKYSLSDFFPSLPRTHALAIYVGAQLAMLSAMFLLVQMLDDPIWLLMILTTQFSSVIFCIPMLTARGSRQGISTASARAMLFAPVAFVAIFMPAVAPEFDTIETYLVAGVCLAIAATYNYVLSTYPPYSVDAQDRAETARSH